VLAERQLERLTSSQNRGSEEGEEEAVERRLQAVEVEEAVVECR
jgi:hypothetical protein